MTSDAAFVEWLVKYKVSKGDLTEIRIVLAASDIVIVAYQSTWVTLTGELAAKVKREKSCNN